MRIQALTSFGSNSVNSTLNKTQTTTKQLNKETRYFYDEITGTIIPYDVFVPSTKKHIEKEQKKSLKDTIADYFDAYKY